jgi:hypothetical protein
VPVATVTLTPATASIGVGGTQQFVVTLRDSIGNVLTGRTIAWMCSNFSVGVAVLDASGNANGLMRGVGAGTATITATSEGKSGTATLTVTAVPAPSPVASVAVSPVAASITVGQTVQLTATPKDAAGNPLSGQVVTWATGNAAVATVSAGGLVTGVAAGSATITAMSAGQSGVSTVTVTAATGGGVIFQSNWTTALGQTATALQDLSAPFGPWTTWDDGGDHLMTVVAGGPPGYGNSLRVQQRGGTATGWGNVTFRNMLPPSQDFYVRFYMMNNDNQYDGDHIVVNEIFSWGNLTYIRKFATATNWLYSNNIFGCAYTYPIGHWFGRLALTNGQWYRFEYWIHYVDATHMQVHERIYDASGALIMGDADIQQEDVGVVWNGSGTWTLASYYAAGYNFCVDPVQMANFSMGNNGQGGALDTGLYWYYAGVQIRTDHWAGP